LRIDHLYQRYLKMLMNLMNLMFLKLHLIQHYLKIRLTETILMYQPFLMLLKSLM
jgi:hypothetical protein